MRSEMSMNKYHMEGGNKYLLSNEEQYRTLISAGKQMVYALISTDQKKKNCFVLTKFTAEGQGGKAALNFP